MFVSTKDLGHATLLYGRLVRALKPIVYECSEALAADTRKNAARVKPAGIRDRVVEV